MQRESPSVGPIDRKFINLTIDGFITLKNNNLLLISYTMIVGLYISEETLNVSEREMYTS